MAMGTNAQVMEYRRLGRTSLNVSLLGFGASPLGNVYSVVDPAEGVRAVAVAIENGINFFDVSPYYGSTLAEERLGKALRGKRQEVVLATKCGRYGLNDFDFSAKRVAESMDESLQRLQTDYIDLFQAHDVEFGDVRQIIEETIPAMRKLQKEGKARYIGITGYPLRILRKIADAVEVDTILSYCHYNLMVTDMDEVLTPFVKGKGIGLINASALHMGLLTEQGAPEWHPAPPKVHEAGRRAALYCRERGVDISDVSLRFCLDHPSVSSTLIGMATTEDVLCNLKALRAASDPELTAEVQKQIGGALNHVWASGRPENQG
jgi:L-galactose dehydrogenase